VGKAARNLKGATGSGNVEVGETGDSVDVTSASGRVTVRRATGGRVRANSTSGRVSIGVAQGVAAWLDIHTVTGRVDSALENSSVPAEGDAKVELKVHTVSGSVDLTRADASAHV
jgi:DUF4097 and DUF4098 domain-containing protein YvlB